MSCLKQCYVVHGSQVISSDLALFQGSDVPGQQLWGCGSGHDLGGWGQTAAGTHHQGTEVLHPQPGRGQVRVP